MGRFERNDKSDVVGLSGIAEYLLSESLYIKYYRSYIFGSYKNGIGVDIDLLFVGPDGEILSLFKKELRDLGRCLPFDVLHMLPSEAEATDFISKEGCIPLSDLLTS